MLTGHAVDGQSAGKLEDQNACAPGLCANLEDCGCLERVVREDCRFEGIVQSAESHGASRKTWDALGRPGIVKSPRRVFNGLSEQELFFAPSIQDNVELAGRCAVQAGVESGPGIR